MALNLELDLTEPLQTKNGRKREISRKFGKKFWGQGLADRVPSSHQKHRYFFSWPKRQFIIFWYLFGHSLNMQVQLSGGAMGKIILTEIPFKCRTVWTQIRPDILSGLGWVKIVCLQYRSLAAKELNRGSYMSAHVLLNLLNV